MLGFILDLPDSSPDSMPGKTLRKSRLQTGFIFLILTAACTQTYAVGYLNQTSRNISGAVEKFRIDSIAERNDDSDERFVVSFGLDVTFRQQLQKALFNSNKYQNVDCVYQELANTLRKDNGQISEIATLISEKTPAARGFYPTCFIAGAERKADQSDENRGAYIDSSGDYIAIFINQECEIFLAFRGLNHPYNTYTMETISLLDGTTHTINQSVMLHCADADISSTEHSDQPESSASPKMDSDGLSYDVFIIKLNLTDDQIKKIKESFKSNTHESVSSMSLTMRRSPASEYKGLSHHKKTLWRLGDSFKKESKGSAHDIWLYDKGMLVEHQDVFIQVKNKEFTIAENDYTAKQITYRLRKLQRQDRGKFKISVGVDIELPKDQSSSFTRDCKTAQLTYMIRAKDDLENEKNTEKTKKKKACKKSYSKYCLVSGNHCEFDIPEDQWAKLNNKNCLGLSIEFSEEKETWEISCPEKNRREIFGYINPEQELTQPLDLSQLFNVHLEERWTDNKGSIINEKTDTLGKFILLVTTKHLEKKCAIEAEISMKQSNPGNHRITSSRYRAKCTIGKDGFFSKENTIKKIGKVSEHSQSKLFSDQSLTHQGNNRIPVKFEIEARSLAVDSEYNETIKTENSLIERTITRSKLILLNSHPGTKESREGQGASLSVDVDKEENYNTIKFNLTPKNKLRDMALYETSQGTRISICLEDQTANKKDHQLHLLTDNSLMNRTLIASCGYVTEKVPDFVASRDRATSRVFGDRQEQSRSIASMLMWPVTAPANKMMGIMRHITGRQITAPSTNTEQSTSSNDEINRKFEQIRFSDD